MTGFRAHLAAAALLAWASASTAAADGMEFVYVSPNPIGVNAFLGMGESGIRASGKEHGAKVTVIESDTPQSRLENVSAVANDGADIVVVLGFAFNDILLDIAPTAPDTQFLIVDQCIFEDRPENVSCAVFRDHEAAFLMGVAAGMNTESDRIGAVSAIDIPFLHRYTDSFRDGARLVNPDVSFDVLWVGGQSPFQDPVRAKELALTLASKGVDTVLAATAGGDFGIFEAAKEEGFKVFSVDVNHCAAAPDHIIDGTLKRVDNAIDQSIDKLRDGTNQSSAQLVDAVTSNGERLARIEGFLGIGMPDAAASKAAGATRPRPSPSEAEDPGPS